jgi:LMBR1 domain-containing protein 1
MTDWFLIVIVAVVAVLAIFVSLYLLVVYQHPEDHNQAWFPKAVVIFGISLAIWTVLLFPLDVANRRSCAADVLVSHCTYVLPMKALWYACYISIGVMVFIICPFAMFYYEADSEA